MKTKKRLRALTGAITDIVLAAVILLVFAYFHHGRMYLLGRGFVEAPAATAQPTAAAAAQPTPETEAPDETLVANGPFTDGTIEQTENSYRSANVSVSWTRHEDRSNDGLVVYYVADIWLRSSEYLRTAYVTNGYRSVHDMAAESNAILAIDGDYAFSREYGPIVRNGAFLRDTGFDDILVYYTDGSMRIFRGNAFDMDAEMEKGAVQVWSFGPALLDAEGKSIDKFNTNIAGLNPRAALGYYEPGHYCFVVVDGRGENGSRGSRLHARLQLRRRQIRRYGLGRRYDREHAGRRRPERDGYPVHCKGVTAGEIPKSALAPDGGACARRDRDPRDRSLFQQRHVSRRRTRVQVSLHGAQRVCARVRRHAKERNKMKLCFKQRFFSWFDSYDIYDASTGATAFTVEGKLAWGHCLHILDAQGRHIATVKERVLTFLPKFDLYIGERSIGTIRKEFTLFRPAFVLDFNGWRVQGSFLEWDYTIEDAAGRTVACISKELLHWTDTYTIDVPDARDALCALMVVLAIDAEKCSRGSN